MSEADQSARFRYRLSGRREREQDVFFEDALDPALWEPGDEGEWDTCWHTGMPERAVFRATAPNRTVNHIPGNNCLTIKSRLDATLRAMRERATAAYGEGSALAWRTAFVPTVYSMPRDYHALLSAAADNPDQLWMLKPKNGARGRDIRLLDDVAETPTDDRWLVQGYLHRPHLMKDRKYVLRLYVLVSSIEPLRVYVYEQGFAKLASCPYTLEDRSNPYVHQTNPDVNARNTDAESPVVFIDFTRYRAWLREQGHDDQLLFERIDDLIALTMIGAREPMRSATARFEADPRGCYELIGLDCLVDEDLNPWLLECNLSPSLGVCAAPNDGGVVEEQVKHQLVTDMVALVGLNEPDRQRVGADGTPEELAAEADAEAGRAGGFRRVYPTAEPERYLPFFPFPRRADMILARHVAGRPMRNPSARRWRVAEVIADDQLTLYAEASGEVFAPNPTASLIWLHASDGGDPDTVVREVVAASGLAPDSDPQAVAAVERQVWDAFADWSRDGLLIQTSPHGADREDTEPRTNSDAGRIDVAEPIHRLGLLCGANPLEVRGWSRPAFRRLERIFGPMQRSGSDAAARQVEIVRSRRGFSVMTDGTAIAENLSLAALGPWLVEDFLARAPEAGEIALPAALVRFPSTGDQSAPRNVLLCREGRAADDRLALAIREETGNEVSGGVRIDLAETGCVHGIGLPLRRAHDPKATDGSTRGMPLWSFGCTGILEASEPGRALQAVEAIVIARNATDEHGSDQAECIGVHAALAYLLPQVSEPGVEHPGRQTVSRIAEWLHERPIYAVDADISVERVLELIATADRDASTADNAEAVRTTTDSAER
ncbi:amylase [Halofilum ochraceum]|uniref:amylase n=1 Tax=Halofilum ochraceum TaxID=1611323 RepID=UPI001586CD87|nr:amylase [Halofilum ochraceum]